MRNRTTVVVAIWLDSRAPIKHDSLIVVTSRHIFKLREFWNKGQPYRTNRSVTLFRDNYLCRSLLLRIDVINLVSVDKQDHVCVLFDSAGFEVGGVFMDSQYIAIIVTAAVMVSLQYLIFEKTLLGKKLQATSQDKEMASLLGIPVAVMILITFGYSAALGGLAGILVAPVLFVSVGMGALISLKAFAANIIGGFGSIPGSILGGLALGVVETFGAAFISVPYKDAIAFGLLLLFLLIRPQGLFGERISEKA